LNQTLLQHMKTQIDRTALKIPSKNEDDRSLFWAQKTYQERLQALADLREEYHQWQYDSDKRLQRVYRVVKREQG